MPAKEETKTKEETYVCIFEQNEKYCSKEGESEEFGIRPKQGQRNDIVAMKEKLDAGQRRLEIAYEDAFMFTVVGQMHRFAETYAQYIGYLIYLYLIPNIAKWRTIASLPKCSCELDPQALEKPDS